MTRTVLAISGADRSSFLQGLVTNDVDKLKDGLVYAALLSPQGKYLADFFLVPLDENTVGLDIESSLAKGVAQRLSMYKLRADVAIAQTELVVSRGIGTPPAQAFADPRHPSLGWRLYGNKDVSDDTDWDAVRVANLVPHSGVELAPNDSFILEQNFEALNGVDFRKGCYVGQEVTARMKHKTELRKGLARVQMDGTAAPGTEITANGKPVGLLHTVAGDHALAYLRFDRATGEMKAGDATLWRAT